MPRMISSAQRATTGTTTAEWQNRQRWQRDKTGEWHLALAGNNPSRRDLTILDGMLSVTGARRLETPSA